MAKMDSQTKAGCVTWLVVALVTFLVMALGARSDSFRQRCVAGNGQYLRGWLTDSCVKGGKVVETVHFAL